MLFTYTESAITTVLEDVAGGAMDEGEAVSALLKDDEILQEIKARNVELLEFLSKPTSVRTMLDLEDDTGFEILAIEDLGLEVARQSDVLLAKLLATEDPAASKWERLLGEIARRHRVTLGTFVTDDVYSLLLEQVARSKASAGLAFRTLFATKPLYLESRDFSETLECSKNLPPTLVAVPLLKTQGRKFLTTEPPLDSVPVMTAFVESGRQMTNLPEALEAYAKDLGNVASTIGERRVAIAGFVGACLARQTKTHDDAVVASDIFVPLIDVFFSFEDHSVYHRQVVDVLLAVFQGGPFLASAVLPILLPRLEVTFVALSSASKSSKKKKTSSLRAHLRLVAEAIADALYRDLLKESRSSLSSSSSSEQEHFLCCARADPRRQSVVGAYFRQRPADFSRFLTFVADHLSRATLQRTTTTPPEPTQQVPDLLPSSVFPLRAF